MNFSLSTSAEYADIAAIHDELYEYNLSKTGCERSEVYAKQLPEAFAVTVRSESGEIVGGAAAHWESDPRHIFIDYLFMREVLRNQGWGHRIFAELEAILRSGKGEYIEVTTNTFQAPGFYLKAGFEIIGEKAAPVPLMPENKHYRLRKKL